MLRTKNKVAKDEDSEKKNKKTRQCRKGTNINYNSGPGLVCTMSEKRPKSGSLFSKVKTNVRKRLILKKDKSSQFAFMENYRKL